MKRKTILVALLGFAIVFCFIGSVRAADTYDLKIYSSPTGVTFTVDDVPNTTPWSGTYSENASVTLVMPEDYNDYVWSHWLEDEDTNRTKIVTMDANITLTGVFTLLLGDLNGDEIIDIYDAIELAGSFGSELGETRWDPEADVNKDGVIDIFDAILLVADFGKTV